MPEMLARRSEGYWGTRSCVVKLDTTNSLPGMWELLHKAYRMMGINPEAYRNTIFTRYLGVEEVAQFSRPSHYYVVFFTGDGLTRRAITISGGPKRFIGGGSCIFPAGYFGPKPRFNSTDCGSGIGMTPKTVIEFENEWLRPKLTGTFDFGSL